MSAKISYYMREAIELAKRSTMESKHGCVIINPRARDNWVVASAVNEHVHNQEDRRVFSIHAEVNALAQLMRIKSHNQTYFEDCIALVARVGPPTQNYRVRMSKPCANCERMLRKMGIRRVFYTLDEATMGELRIHRMC